MSLREAHDNRTTTFLKDIIPDDDVSSLSFDRISFEPYDNPDVSIDTSARFATHDIVGGTTVRQKIGEEPTEVEISGVCTEDTALKVDKLRKVKLVTIITARLPEGIRCQVASTSTEPLSSGGVVDIDDTEFLYNFNINLVEIEAVPAGSTTDRNIQ